MVKIEDENQEKKEEERDNEASKDESTHDPYFAPVVNLPEMEVRLLFNLNVELNGAIHMIIFKGSNGRRGGTRNLQDPG